MTNHGAVILSMGKALRRPEPPGVERVYKQLTFAEGLETDPAIAPDGKSFAYALAHTGNRDIYIQRVDGRAAINITADSPDDESEPAFSPDGSKIAFRSERDGGGIFGDVIVVVRGAAARSEHEARRGPLVVTSADALRARTQPVRATV